MNTNLNNQPQANTIPQPAVQPVKPVEPQNAIQPLGPANVAPAGVQSAPIAPAQPKAGGSRKIVLSKDPIVKPVEQTSVVPPVPNSSTPQPSGGRKIVLDHDPVIKTPDLLKNVSIVPNKTLVTPTVQQETVQEEVKQEQSGSITF